MNRILLLALPIAIALGGGCQKEAVPQAATASGPSEPVEAQPKLQTMNLWVGPEEMIVELALTPEQQLTGMMFRTNLTENAGMLFPLPMTQFASIWMKNVSVPLSGAYIDREGVIQEIHEFQPQNTNAVVSATNNIRFILEAPQGWFQRHNVRTGMIVRAERGTLLETFSRRR